MPGFNASSAVAAVVRSVGVRGCRRLGLTLGPALGHELVVLGVERCLGSDDGLDVLVLLEVGVAASPGPVASPAADTCARSALVNQVLAAL